MSNFPGVWFRVAADVPGRPRPARGLRAAEPTCRQEPLGQRAVAHKAKPIETRGHQAAVCRTTAAGPVHFSPATIENASDELCSELQFQVLDSVFLVDVAELLKLKAENFTGRVKYAPRKISIRARDSSLPEDHGPLELIEQLEPTRRLWWRNTVRNS
jgi:hypothetical protein